MISGFLKYEYNYFGYIQGTFKLNENPAAAEFDHWPRTLARLDERALEAIRGEAKHFGRWKRRTSGSTRGPSRRPHRDSRECGVGGVVRESVASGLSVSSGHVARRNGRDSVSQARHPCA